MSKAPQGAHLVGSGPFDTAEDMFRFTMKHMGRNIKRLPDGEVGERDTWIRWQYPRIGQSPQMQPQETDNVYVPYPPYEIIGGVSSADEIEFPNLGYGDAAIESHAVFQKLEQEGVIPSSVRFMVGLPTPLSVASFYVALPYRDTFQQAYSRALKAEFQKMVDAIPPDRLAIQWEIVCEFALLEGIVENHIGDNLLDYITSHGAELIDMVPDGVEAGIHLCYGDSGHKHFCEPADTGHLVDVSNGVTAKTNRPIAWIHMPVPKERDDEGYYGPLSGLKLQDGTELFLGLIHNTGGQEGTEKRLATAQSVVTNFGIATECGLARRQRETMVSLMGQHTSLSEKV